MELVDVSRFRSLCEEVFQKYSEYERIEKFSRPKLLRLLEILRIFRPPNTPKPLPQPDALESIETPPTTSSEIATVEAQPLSPGLNELQDSQQFSVELQIPPETTKEVQQLPIESIPDEKPTLKEASIESSDTNPVLSRPPTTQPVFSSRRRRPDFTTRHHRMREDAHQLCGIIFTEKRTTAKLLYHLLKVQFVAYLARVVLIYFVHKLLGCKSV